MRLDTLTTSPLDASSHDPFVQDLDFHTVKMATKEYTYQDVAEHNTKKDCFLVVHDKVYDCGKFIDEHP